MKTFTGYQYLLIDISNNFGLDKLNFEQRIQWATDNLVELESLASKAEKPPLYQKAVMALRKAQAGLPTGHRVGFDAVCSGVQIMSVVTGCVAGARATGLVDPDKRADAYTEVTAAMEVILGGKLTISRADAKRALMTSMYGSKAVPKELFGEDTPELDAFYAACHQVAPGAWELLQDLLGSWKPYALVHKWKLPDGFDACVKVMSKQEARIEVDELNHATFTYEFYENEGTQKGLSNVANVVHSIDAYVLRCIHRRCNYDAELVMEVGTLIEIEMMKRSMGLSTVQVGSDETMDYYIQQYFRSGMADVVILPYLDINTITVLPGNLLEALAVIVNGMLEYKPFEVVAIH
jgi:DNA-dependent RNA polymerase